MTIAKYGLYIGGIGSVVYGAWLICHPAGFIIGGLLAFALSMILDRAKEGDEE